METRVFEIKLKDGRIFRIFCANSKQVKKIAMQYKSIQDKAIEFSCLASGLHTVKEFKDILKTI